MSKFATISPVTPYSLHIPKYSMEGGSEQYDLHLKVESLSKKSASLCIGFMPNVAEDSSEFSWVNKVKLMISEVA